MAAKFTLSKEVLQQSMAVMLENQTGHDAEELSAQLGEDTEVPIMDLIDHELPQFFAHALPRGVYGALSEALYVQQQVSNRKGFLKAATRVGSVGPVTGGIFAAGVESGLFNTSAEAITLDLIGVTALSAYTVAGGYKMLKNYLSLAEAREARFRRYAELAATTVADDLHRAFCAEHFNAETKKMMGFEPGEEES